MSDTDPLPRPPRRRIHGVTWVWTRHYRELSHHGITLLGVEPFNDDEPMPIFRFGYSMGCVKDDDGDLFTEDAG